jgi:hypothetical protein
VLRAVERVGRTLDTAAGSIGVEAVHAVRADVLVRTRQAVRICATDAGVVLIDGLSVVEMAAVRILITLSIPSEVPVIAQSAVSSLRSFASEARWVAG